MSMGLSEDGAFIETEEGTTFVRAIGRGPLVFVIHGGPGFDHRYLVSSLSFLAETRTLIFYDQPGCGRTPAPEGDQTASQTFRHFRALSRELADDKPSGVVAHSWGALVFVASFFEPSHDRASEVARFQEGILINPVPITRGEYDAGVERLVSRIPPLLVQHFVETLHSHNGDGKIMQALMPYYRVRPFARPVAEFPFTPVTYAAITASLGAFDYTHYLDFAKHLSIVLGEQDFTGVDLLSKLTAACCKTEIMPSVGHFPFFEAPDEFEAICRRCFY
jgi:pimeloyl-ACP methyl ester carboxylesterase